MILSPGASFDAIQIAPEGRNGALPNQDLVNVPMMLAHGLDRFHASLAPTRHNNPWRRHDAHQLPAPLAGWIRTVADTVSSIVTSIDGRKTAGDRARTRFIEYAGDLERIARFVSRCASGTPTGAHASFKTFATDAVTLRAVRYADVYEGRVDVADHEGDVAMYKLGLLMEGLTRGSNNLLELLHHSMFYFIMVDDDKFLSIAEYIAPQALMLVALLLTAIALAVHGAAPPPAPDSSASRRRGRGGGDTRGVGGDCAKSRRLRFGLLRLMLPRRQGGDVSDGDGDGHVDNRRGDPSAAAVAAAAARSKTKKKTKEETKKKKLFSETDGGPIILHDWSSALTTATCAYIVGIAAGVTCLMSYDAGASAARTTATVGLVAYGGAAALLVALTLKGGGGGGGGEHLRRGDGGGGASGGEIGKGGRRKAEVEVRMKKTEEEEEEEEDDDADDEDDDDDNDDASPPEDDEDGLYGSSSTLTFSREAGWTTLKVVTLTAASTALGALTFFNFALALPVTAFLVPVCLASGPSSSSSTSSSSALVHGAAAAMAGKKQAREVTRVRMTAAAGSGAMGVAVLVVVATLAAPAVVASLVSTAAGSTPRDALGAFAAHHRGLEGGTFALPLAFGVVWPTVVLCAAVTLSAQLSSSLSGVMSGRTHASEDEEKKRSKKVR